MASVLVVLECAESDDAVDDAVSITLEEAIDKLDAAGIEVSARLNFSLARVSLIAQHR